MSFLGDFQLLQDMKQAAFDEVMENYRPRSKWDARDAEYIEDPESDPCEAVHRFYDEMDDCYEEFFIKAFDAELKAEERWWAQLSYQEFLHSDYWQDVKKAVLLRDKNRCQKCGAVDGLQVHHRWYPKRGTELDHLGALVTLCSRCHSREHH